MPECHDQESPNAIWQKCERENRDLTIGAIALIAFVLILYAVTAHAHHQEGHRVLYVGVPTQASVQIDACKSEQRMQAVFEAVKRDYRRGQAMARYYARQGACRPVVGLVRIEELLDSAIIRRPDGSNVRLNFFSFVLVDRQNNPLTPVMFGQANVPVREHADDA